MLKLPSYQELLNLQEKIASHDDQQAFAKLYMAFQPYLHSFAYAIIHNQEMAEEIVSDVFLQIWQHRKRLLHIEAFRLYLYTCTRNTAINYLKKTGRKPTLSLDEWDIPLHTGIYNPEQLMITSEAVRKIDAAILNLPPRCKAIFKLAKEDGLRYQEIASLLNISVNTIDQQMAIALKKISTAIHFDLKKSQRSFS
jgi:RNA polymerase sigma-70 factor (family 1)